MTRPRLSQWVSGCATVLVVALLATPLWDFWHYRGLRSGPGAGLAVGLILPPAPPPRRDLAAGLLAPSPIPARIPDAAARGPVSATVEASLSTTGRARPASESPAKASAGTGTAAAAPMSVRNAASGHANHVPAAAPAGLPEPAGPNIAPVTSGSGWLLAPPTTTQTAKPGPPPDPQPAPPPPRHVDPLPSVAEPHPIPQALPVLSLGPPADDVAIGQDVVVDVRLNSARDITSLPFHVQFDPAVVEFVSASQGSALSSLQPVLLASVNPARPGDLAVGLSFVDAGGTFNGSGSILSLHFRALASGVSPLTFDRASVRGATSQPLQAQFEGASVRVR